MLSIPSAVPAAQLLLSRHWPGPRLLPSADTLFSSALGLRADPEHSGSAVHRGVVPGVCLPHGQLSVGARGRLELRWLASVHFFP